MNVWQKFEQPFFILAPMEAVTDHVFRRVVNEAAAPDVFFSEFTNATGWVHAGEKAVAGRLTIHPDEKYPLIAQIWCSEPDDIEKLAIYCKNLGYQGIDVNMGCPAKTAVKNSGGSAMIRQPELAAKIIQSAKKAGLPVSVKTRLGYTNIQEWEGWLTHILQQDISALTIHLRTKKEMSKVPAHWELMPNIRKLRDEISPHTLLIGNGDVKDRAHGEALIKQTGIDGIMIGRGVFSNIFAFEEVPTAHTKQELLALLHLHLNLFEESNIKFQTSDISAKPYQTLKRFFKIYIRDFPGSHDIRNLLMESSAIDEARVILDNNKI
jgi:tRNA-dihydrouridine synthase